MEVFDRFFSTGRQQEDILQEAQTAVKIVNNGVEKGAYSELTDQLNTLPNLGISRETYVFGYNRSSIGFWGIIAGIVLSIGYLFYIPVFIGTLLYSGTFDVSMLAGLILAFIIVILNIFFIMMTVSQMRFNKRYNTYIKDLRFKNIEIIDDLSAYANIGCNTVIKDLNKAVKLKLIPQGHFGCEDMIFIVSNEVYDRYKAKQAVYDRYYRKQIEERLRMKERTKELQEILDQGQSYVDKIHESNDIIKDRLISQKLDRMESVVSMIFHEVDINPHYADKLGMFMNYYLPTTEKLLEAYIEIDEKRIKGKALEKARKDIEGAIDKIIESFEGLLDKFYQEREADIATDISAMEILMKQDGLTD